MSKGQIPYDDNGKTVLALWNDATGQAIPVHIGTIVTGIDGLSYAVLDINVKNANSNGQALMVNSAPVVVASDQSALPIKMGVTGTVYSGTQTGISATGDSGDLSVGQYRELLVMVNLSGFTGTSINFRILAKDAFGNYMNIGSSGNQGATGFVVFSVGMGASNNNSFADTVKLQWLCTSVTSATFQATVKGK